MSRFLDWILGRLLRRFELSPEQRAQNDRSRMIVERILRYPWRAID